MGQAIESGVARHEPITTLEVSGRENLGLEPQEQSPTGHYREACTPQKCAFRFILIGRADPESKNALKAMSLLLKFSLRAHGRKAKKQGADA